MEMCTSYFDNLKISCHMNQFFFFFSVIHPPPQDPDVRPLSELDSSTLMDLLPELPFWVKNPNYDRVSIAF